MGVSRAVSHLMRNNANIVRKLNDEPKITSLANTTDAKLKLMTATGIITFLFTKPNRRKR